MRIVIALVFLASFPSKGFAEYSERCGAKYQAGYGWSKTYSVVCTYAKGSELNTATRSYRYKSYKTYAVIFWSSQEASVIELRQSGLCGFWAEDGCASPTFGGKDGVDQAGRRWKICSAHSLAC